MTPMSARNATGPPTFQITPPPKPPAMRTFSANSPWGTPMFRLTGIVMLV